MPAAKLLADVFGFDAFRPGQEPVMRALIAGRAVVAVLCRRNVSGLLREPSGEALFRVRSVLLRRRQGVGA